MKIGSEYYRPTWAEVNLKNLDYNFRLVRRLVGPGVKILVPVKADAYGHGIIVISLRLERLGADYLGVSSVDEGINLREAGVKIPILILSPVFNGAINPVLDYALTPSVCTRELARGLNRQAEKRGVILNIHIKVDTGMHRIGVAHESAYAFIKRIAVLKNLKIEGVFTHFPCADNKPSFTRVQIGMFNRLLGKLKESGVHIPIVHASNSLGVIDYPQAHFNMVRPGLMIYGLYPKEDLMVRLRPLLSLKTRVAYIKTVPKGRGISYGHTYVTGKKMRIATLPIGYGDGYPRSLSNKAYCLIGGEKARIVGRVCMDQLMVDVTGIKGIRVSREAVLIGRQKGKVISAEYLAGLAHTIPYEIVCNLGNRIKRIYRPAPMLPCGLT